MLRGRDKEERDSDLGDAAGTHVDIATNVAPVLSVNDVTEVLLEVLSCPHSVQPAWRYGNHVV